MNVLELAHKVIKIQGKSQADGGLEIIQQAGDDLETLVLATQAPELENTLRKFLADSDGNLVQDLNLPLFCTTIAYVIGYQRAKGEYGDNRTREKLRQYYKAKYYLQGKGYQQQNLHDQMMAFLTSVETYLKELNEELARVIAEAEAKDDAEVEIGEVGGSSQE